MTIRTCAIATLVAWVSVFGGFATTAAADETCQSPYLPKITGQEDFVYVWTLGIEGIGDGSDKFVTVGANPDRPDYGKVVASVSVGGRHEAHHGGFTDDRKHFWAGGLDDSMINVFDVATDPAEPKLINTIDDFVEKTGGVVGPHTFYALPGRMLINGDVVGEGVGGDALGPPFVPLAWLANNLNERGTMLRMGDIVLTGSIVTTKWLQPGDHIVTEVDGLGRASLTVT